MSRASDVGLSDLVHELRLSGYVFRSALMPDVTTADVAAIIGTIENSLPVPPVQVLVPRARSDAPRNIYSGNFGLGSFPLHSDLAHWHLPPRFVLFRCAKGSNDVATPIFDGLNIVKALGADRMRRALVRPRRPNAGRTPLLSLLGVTEHGTLLRWDELFLKPASSEGARVFASVREFLGSATTIPLRLREKGDTLVVDNWRILHGRDPVPPRSRDRAIERVYLSEVNQ